MNITKSNSRGLFYAERGPYSRDMLAKWQHRLGDAVDKKDVGDTTFYEIETKGDNAHCLKLPIDIMIRPKDQKILRLSRRVVENAKLINIESVLKNCNSIDFDFKSLFVLLDCDRSGYIKYERSGADIYYIYSSDLDTDNPQTGINVINFIEGDYLYDDERVELPLQVLTYLFFGDITSRFIKAKDSVRVEYSRIVNNSKMDVVFVDSLWKERISTDGFKVRGHFRLQPVGEGRSNKKLIWIDEYNKHGYNRRATVEIQKDKDHDPH